MGTDFIARIRKTLEKKCVYLKELQFFVAALHSCVRHQPCNWRDLISLDHFFRCQFFYRAEELSVWLLISFSYLPFVHNFQASSCRIVHLNASFVFCFEIGILSNFWILMDKNTLNSFKQLPGRHFPRIFGVMRLRCDAAWPNFSHIIWLNSRKNEVNIFFIHFNVH
jgi:hypothetical protein